MMKNSVFLLLFSYFFITSCQNQQVENQYNLIPLPNSLEAKSGRFRLENNGKLLLGSGVDESVRKVAEQFAAQLKQTAGRTLSVEELTGEELPKRAIGFVQSDEFAPEGYSLSVSPESILIKASQPAGFFYGVQSLKQLLPTAIYGKEEAIDAEWSVPCVEITDAPRFKYRGMHMDVSRHFFSVEEVKKYIDALSLHKLNTLHWHLTDDQGWRIEIKKYPRLVEVGSIRKGTMIKKEWENYDGLSYGGFYTQDQIRDVIAYAQERFITIVPEIDLPGHMMAALASYADLGCTGGPYNVSGQWGVRDEVLCVGKETTFGFIEDVLTEVIDLFPSEYIHIGGDECPKVRWEKCPHCQAKIKELGIKSDESHPAEHYLQSYVISRVEKFVNSKGRQIIGWDEILEGGLAPNAILMSWRGTEGGIEAARQKHEVIMTPASHLYFDYYQSMDTENEPFSIGGYVPLEKVYGFEPIPEELKEDERNYIIGVQANLWSEYIPTSEQLEYQLLPRLAALSEVQWTQPERKELQQFLTRLESHFDRYDQMGLNYAKHLFEVKADYKVNADNQCVEAILTTRGNAPIYYTLDGTDPTTASTLYTTPVELTQSCTLKAMVDRGTRKTRVLKKSFVFNKATAKKATMNTLPKDKYTYGGASVLTDGIRGDFNYANGCWLGYLDEPLDVIIDLTQEMPVSSVKIGTMFQMGEYVFPLTKLTVSVSLDGKEYKTVAAQDYPLTEKKEVDGLKEFATTFATSQARFVHVVAFTTSQMPSWHGAKGEKAYMFVDEIIID